MHDFGCHVLSCTHPISAEFSRSQDSSHTKINELNVAISADHNVLKLHVPVHNVTAVKETECDHDLCYEELHNALFKAALLQHQIVQCAPLDKGHPQK